jgi:hypothetical protein
MIGLDVGCKDDSVSEGSSWMSGIGVVDELTDMSEGLSSPIPQLFNPLGDVRRSGLAIRTTCRLHVLSDPSFPQPALCGQGEYSPEDAPKKVCDSVQMSRILHHLRLRQKTEKVFCNSICVR